MDSTTRKRVFFYVQHLLGIGHLARASRICKALVAKGFDVTMVTGGRPVPGFPGPEVRNIALPAVAAGDAGFKGLVDISGTLIDDDFKADRRAMLIAAFHEIQPDIVMTEAFPFGRRQMRFELLPFLDEVIATRPKPLVVASLRDLLQERAKPIQDEETVGYINQYYDRVLVHGDPNFASLADSFPLHEAIADKVIYTGLVAAPPPSPPAEIFDIVVSAGGGAVGIDVIRAAVESAKRLPADLSWCMVTGPNLPQADFDAIAADAPSHIKLFRFRQDFSSLLAGARLSVSQAGYNTVGDILRAGCQSLLMPFTAGGETEQAARAERLEKLGRAFVLSQTELSADNMIVAIRKALESGAPKPHGLDLDGANRTAEILGELSTAG